MVMGDNPAPALGSLSPGSIVEGGPAVTLTVTGTGFVSDGVVQANGTPLATTFLSSTEVRALLPAALAAEEGTITLTVLNPGPGGGLSNGQSLTVADFTPVVTVGSDVTVRNGQMVTRAGSFADSSADTWTATVDYGDGGGTQPLALAGHTFALAHRYTTLGTHSVAVTILDDEGISATGTFLVSVLPAAAVQSVVLNDGSAQRSMIGSISVTFTAAVGLSPGAFTLARTFHGATSDVSGVVQVTTALTPDGRTVATLTFAGAGIVGSSLADGDYTLSLAGDHVHDHQLGAVLSSDRVDHFFRLFGDANGNGQVDRNDQNAFLRAYHSRRGSAKYRSYFDFNSDGVINTVDYNQFLQRQRAGLRKRPRPR
jgi:hypothetical protein